MPRQEGKFLVEDYVFGGGLNTNDSPFVIQTNQSTGGQNYDYIKRGGIQKRSGHAKLNAAASTNTRTLGLGLWNKPNSTRYVVRAAGRKLQNFDQSAYTFSNLAEDVSSANGITATITIAAPAVITATSHGYAVTDPVVFTTTGALPTGIVAGTTYYVSVVVSANTFQISTTPNGASITTTGTQSGTQTVKSFNTTFLANGTTTQVPMCMFNTATNGIMWCGGGGLTNLYGAISATQVTANGVAAPTYSSFTGTPSGADGTLPAGDYYYTLVFRKASTQALSNASIDSAKITVGATNHVALAWTLTNNDVIKYDQIYIYRTTTPSSPSTGFTAGALVAQVASSATTYTDTGTTVNSSVVVPRANSTTSDNSQLPSGTYNTVTLMKRRLVTASGSTLYFSDINSPEAWPTAQYITVPSGGEITALAVIGLTSPLSTDIDEALVIFKQTECWVVTGDGTYNTGIPNWSLKFVDNSGAPNQAVVVPANGYIGWLTYRGIFLWNGAGKPQRVTLSIKDKWQSGGDIDKSKLNESFGIFSQKRNEMQWYMSSKSLGEQQYVLKLDLDLTMAPTVTSASSALGDRQLTGIFTPDFTSFAVYAGLACIPNPTSTDETIYLGDGTGFICSGYSTTADEGSSIAFQYTTPFLNQGSINTAKQYHKIILWVLNNGVYNININFWSNYRFAANDSSSSSLPVAANFQGVGLLWDIGKWDVNYWDTNTNQIEPLVYNLSSVKNNTQGDCIQLQFTETSALNTPTIYGFSVYYTDLGLRK